MDLIQIVIIFAVVIFIIKKDKPFHVAMGSGIVVALIVYQVPFSLYPSIIKESLFGRTTLVAISSFYTISFLQKMLDKRGRLLLTEKSISRIFNSRRINATLVPFIIGMLPTIGAVLIAAPIVEAAVDDDLDEDETTFVISYYRHITELFLPTYGPILLALQLTGISAGNFVAMMIPLIVAIFLIGYFLYVRKIPKGGEEMLVSAGGVDILESVNYKEEWINVIKGTWAILSTILLILIFELPVYMATIGVIIVNFFVEKFEFEEIKPLFKESIEIKLILTTIVVMTFKEVLLCSGIVERLPGYFVHLPINPKIIFALLFFLGTIVAGSNTMVATILPLAFETLPDVGMAYFTLLMALTYIAMQVSPTHVCLAVILSYRRTSYDGLIKKTMPALIIFVIVAVIYTYGLSFIVG